MNKNSNIRGTVTKSTGSWYRVRLPGGETVEARLKGKMRLGGSRATNPVSVGDEVLLEYTKDKVYVIGEVLPRKNYLVRKSTNLSKLKHVIAANIDLVAVVASVVRPRTPLGFIDRVLATAEAYDIPAVILFNKIDLATEGDLPGIDGNDFIYGSIGYRVIRTSAVTGEGTSEFKELLTDRTTLLTGQSGAGKSSLINYIEPGLHLKTAEVSDYNEKGKHTTTFAEMFFTSFGARLIDTPGLRSFGLVDIDKKFLAHYFPEMRQYLGQCRFNDCVHINEPGCAVKAALENGAIAPSRYENYLMIYFDELEYE